MKFSCCTVVVCLTLFSCSTKTENENENKADPDESKIKIERLGEFGIRLRELDSLAQKQGETLNLFVGTRQEVTVGMGWIKVSAASAKNPESNRHDIPRRWETIQGVYVGIPIDSLEAINGAPFYVQLVNNKLTIANWEGGKLSGSGVWADFTIEGNHKPEPFMLSRDIIKNGWRVRCATFMYYYQRDYANWNEPRERCQGYPGDYPFLSFKEMTSTDLEEFNPRNMRIMRNEVFARHGYIFKSDDLKEYFAAKSWYKPQFANVDDQLTELEKANVTLLQDIETRNRNSPLAKLIRKLPFLELPYDLNGAYPPPVYIDSIIGYPDVEVTSLKKAGLTGLLPDTSKFFGVVWIRTPPEESDESDPGAVFIYSSDGGRNITAETDEVAVYITTLDKNMNHIQTVIAKTYKSLIYEDATSSACSIDESFSASLNRDWTFSSEYKAVRSCPTSGADLKSTYEEGYAGKIKKDGTIE